jgi:hypothetical protein
MVFVARRKKIDCHLYIGWGTLTHSQSHTMPPKKEPKAKKPKAQKNAGHKINRVHLCAGYKNDNSPCEHKVTLPRMYCNEHTTRLNYN